MVTYITETTLVTDVTEIHVFPEVHVVTEVTDVTEVTEVVTCPWSGAGHRTTSPGRRRRKDGPGWC